MGSRFSGRLDRFHFFVVLFGLYGCKYAFNAFHVGNGTSMGFTVLIGMAVIARFHDLDQPTGAAVLALLAVWAIPTVVLFAAIDMDHLQTASKAPGGLILNLPTWLMLSVALPEVFLIMGSALIPGDDGANRFGPTGQGFHGWLRHSQQGVSATEPEISVARTVTPTQSGVDHPPYRAIRVHPLVSPPNKAGFGRRI